MAKGYWVAIYREIHDTEKLQAYAEMAGPEIEKFGGKFITRGMPTKVYEAGIKERTTIIEFDSVAQAIALHDSPGYQEALKVLDNGVTRDLRMIEGVE